MTNSDLPESQGASADNRSAASAAGSGRGQRRSRPRNSSSTGQRGDGNNAGNRNRNKRKGKPQNRKRSREADDDIGNRIGPGNRALKAPRELTEEMDNIGNRALPEPTTWVEHEDDNFGNRDNCNVNNRFPSDSNLIGMEDPYQVGSLVMAGYGRSAGARKKGRANQNRRNQNKPQGRNPQQRQGRNKNQSRGNGRHQPQPSDQPQQNGQSRQPRNRHQNRGKARSQNRTQNRELSSNQPGDGSTESVVADSMPNAEFKNTTPVVDEKKGASKPAVHPEVTSTTESVNDKNVGVSPSVDNARVPEKAPIKKKRAVRKAKPVAEKPDQSESEKGAPAKTESKNDEASVTKKRKTKTAARKEAKPAVSNDSEAKPAAKTRTKRTASTSKDKPAKESD